MKIKKVIIIIFFILIFICSGIIFYYASTRNSMNGVVFLSEEKPLYEINSQNSKSKNITIEIILKDNDELSGSISVEIIGNNGEKKDTKEIKIGEKYKKTINFSEGGKEKIIIKSNNYAGPVNYSLRIISDFFSF